MIHQIYSDLPKFKSVQFRPGLNLLLADTTPGATERQTRNGAGKTSLIELVHFLLGATVDKSSLFKSEALSEHSFGIAFDLGGVRTTIERAGNNPSKIVLEEGDTSSWPVKPSLEKDAHELVVSNSNWRTVLGKLMFDLRGGDETDQAVRFGPSFRSLFAYFVRRQLANAFSSPEKQSDTQQPYDQQVAISYLLGLDWTISQQWQEVREKEKSLRDTRRNSYPKRGGRLRRS